MQGVFFHVNILYMSERLNFRQLLREKDSDAVVYIIGICIFFITGITALIIKGIAVRYNINMLTECSATLQVFTVQAAAAQELLFILFTAISRRVFYITHWLYMLSYLPHFFI